MTTRAEDVCGSCDCADPTTLPGIAAECSCGCHGRRKAAAQAARRRPAMVEAPFKFLLVDGESRRFVVCRPDGEIADVRGAFKNVHGFAAGRKAKLFVIPAAVQVEDGLTYAIPLDAVNFAWVEVR